MLPMQWAMTKQQPDCLALTVASNANAAVAKLLASRTVNTSRRDVDPIRFHTWDLL